MSAAPTVAMLAAHRGQAYEVPFQGQVSFVHVEDAALRFISAVSREGDGAHVFDMNGTVAAVSSVNEMIRERLPTASLGQVGDPMPFPAEPDDGELNAYLGLDACRTMQQGVADTLACFDSAQSRGVDLDGMMSEILEKGV
jgi:nucleoside-diphosphate-sugar epimerase